MNKSVSPDPLALFPTEHLSLWGKTNQEKVESIELGLSCIDELVAAARQSTEKSFTEIPRDSMPACCALVEEVRSSLLLRSGAVIIDRFPVEEHDLATSRKAAGILSNLIAPLMSQDIKGTLLYDVIDTKVDSTTTTRRSKTNVSQPFHTDGPWYHSPAAFIGLFCVQPAKQGGFSQVSSLQKVFNLVKSTKDFQNILEDSVRWNKMGQFSENELPYTNLPILSTQSGRPLIRHYADYVRSGHDLAGEAIPDDLSDILVVLDDLLLEHACTPFRLEAGQFQFVNNWQVAHARAGFDDPDTESGRHLIRLWNHNIHTS